MFVCCFTAVLFLIPSFALASECKQKAQSELKTSRYLSSEEILREEVRQHPDNQEAARLLAHLEGDLSAQLASPTVSFLDRAYLEGLFAWERRDSSEARNRWFAYLERK